ncbi:MAG: hypothetical protein MJE66_22090, partial [Proteobacteria bacterium]|nr:hypothetical protein [Pseudomonadota bacterium]
MAAERRVTVFDCGGRGGIHRSWEDFPVALHYESFEPEAEEAAALARLDPRKNGPTRFQVVNRGLDERPGWRRLHVYDSPDLSSFYELDPTATYRYRSVALDRVCRVHCTTVDLHRQQSGLAPDYL